MSKDKLTDYSSTADSNTDIGGISIAEGMSPSAVNNAIREQMSHQKEAFGSGTPLYVDQTNNRVGIGTTTEGIADYGDTLTLADSDHCGMTIRSGTSSEGNVYFSDGTSGDAEYKGIVKYDHSSNAMSFWSNSLRRVTIDSSGNMLIGKTADNVATVGIEARATGPLISTRDGSDALRLNRLNSDGEIIQLRQDGSVVGSIKAGNGDLLIGTGDVNLRFFDATPAVIPRTASDGTSNTVVDLGNVSNSFKDLYSQRVKGAAGHTGEVHFTGSHDIRFVTNGNERGRFDSSGRLLISTSSLINNDGAYLQSNGGSNLAFGFNVNYDGTLGRFYRSSSIVGSISVTTSNTAYNTSSDRRLKSNIEDAASASDKIDAIQVRQFDWDVDGHHQDYGLIAQELQPIEPMAVTGDTDSDEMMGVDYSKLVPMLIKEIQELRGRVAALEAN